MGKTGEDADASLVTMEKKSKKNKNEISDLSDVDGEVNIKKGKGKKRKRDSSTQIEGSLIRGKRFTPEEDKILKDAVNNYITDNNLAEDGLMTVINCSSRRMKKKCWQQIGKCIPYRPDSAVYFRAHILFERTESCGFTPKEIETLKELHEKYDNKWKKMDMRS
nr:RNA polymerase I termination factor [Tanacetum cinerariifolium]